MSNENESRPVPFHNSVEPIMDNENPPSSVLQSATTGKRLTCRIVVIIIITILIITAVVIILVIKLQKKNTNTTIPANITLSLATTTTMLTTVVTNSTALTTSLQVTTPISTNTATASSAITTSNDMNTSTTSTITTTITYITTTLDSTCNVAACRAVISSYIANNRTYDTADFGECLGCLRATYPNYPADWSNRWYTLDFYVVTGVEADCAGNPYTGNLTTCQKSCLFDTTCVGFSREKSVPDADSTAQCWLKNNFPSDLLFMNSATWHSVAFNITS